MQPPGMLGNEGWQGGIQASDYEPCWEERKDVSCEGVRACLRLLAGDLASCVYSEEEWDELPALRTL